MPAGQWRPSINGILQRSHIGNAFQSLISDQYRRDHRHPDVLDRMPERVAVRLLVLSGVQGFAGCCRVETNLGGQLDQNLGIADVPFLLEEGLKDAHGEWMSQILLLSHGEELECEASTRLW